MSNAPKKTEQCETEMGTDNNRDRRSRGRSRSDVSRKRGLYGLPANSHPATEARNDWHWSIKDEAELKRVATLNFAQASGLKYTVSDAEFITSGICAMDLAQGPGLSTNPHSAINQAMNYIYSWVRHANSGSTNYDPPDLMMYLTAMDSIFSIVMHIQRALGTVDYYNTFNRYYPKALIAAMGFDFDELVDNRYQIISKFNNLIKCLDTFRVPKSIKIYERHMWAYTNIYKDGEDDKTQLYLFRPANYYTLEEFVPKKAGFLSAHAITYNEYHSGTLTPHIMKIDKWFDILHSMIDPIATSGDFQTMNGDIIRIYGNDVWSLGLITENYQAPIAYDELVLEQMSNATAISRVFGHADVTQDTNRNILLWDPWVYPTFLTNSNYQKVWDAKAEPEKMYQAPYLLNFFYRTGTPEDVYEATRLMNDIKFVRDTTNARNNHFKFRSLGPDFMTNVTILRLNSATTYPIIGFEYNYLDIIPIQVTSDANPVQAVELAASTFQQYLERASVIKQFRFAPTNKIAVYFEGLTSGPTINWLNDAGLFVDVDNYTTVDSELLYTANETGNLGFYSVGDNAK